MIQAHFEKTFEAWRSLARTYLSEGVAPQEINWDESQPMSFLLEAPVEKKPLKQAVVSQEFLDLAESVAYARDADRWNLLYRILYRLQHENAHLLKISVDEDVMRANHLAHSVRRDIHKMHAFVRFKKTLVAGEEVYVAWHKAEHFSVRLGTPFFARRFGDRRWSLFTPDESAHWDLHQLQFGPGLEQHQFHIQDEWDEVWKTYYKSIFNPARIKVKMMKSEMSPKYWSSMPETALISDLIRSAPQKLQTMAANQRQAAVVDGTLSLEQLQKSAQSCTACPLYRQATQTVFGEGPSRARVMIVGEQPGDQEDLQGSPFVGPAGKILDQALLAAGLDRSQIYLTNAVKHFKWVPQGGARLHQKPSGGEMHACKPWLEAEISRIQPEIIIALGTTAATAVIGRLPRISNERGKVIADLSIAPKVILSWHPSAILRAMDSDEANERTEQLQSDLKLAKESLVSATGLEALLRKS